MDPSAGVVVTVPQLAVLPSVVKNLPLLFVCVGSAEAAVVDFVQPLPLYVQVTELYVYVWFRVGLNGNEIGIIIETYI
jgi:hypothetical protein